jgi:hypothetical protein
MNKLSEFSDSFDRYVSPKISFLNNEYVNAFLMIILIAYASLAAPRLPENIVRMFDHPLTKLVVFFLIVYLAKYNAGVAIIAAVAVLITLMTLNKYNVQREMMGNLSTMESNLDKCNGWDCERVVQENNQQVVDNVEGNESEFTESGHPVDFTNGEQQIVNLPTVQQIVHSENVNNAKELVQEVQKEVATEVQTGKNIISSSVSGIKNLLKKAHIIEGYENSDSSSYSEF